MTKRKRAVVGLLASMAVGVLLAILQAPLWVGLLSIGPLVFILVPWVEADLWIWRVRRESKSGNSQKGGL